MEGLEEAGKAAWRRKYGRILGRERCAIVQRARPKERSGGQAVGGPVRRVCESDRSPWLRKWQDRNEESWRRKEDVCQGCWLLSGLSLEGPQGPHPWPISRCCGTHAASPWTPRTRTHGRAELTYKPRCLSCAATSSGLGHKTEESQLPEGLSQF